MPDLAPAAARVAALIDGVSDDRLTDPTPCAEYTVGDLVDHLIGLSTAFIAVARKEPGQGGGQGSADRLSPHWRDELRARLDELVTAWRDPSAVEGEVTAAGMTLPGAVWNIVALDELVLHGWDLARATDQSYVPDAASTTEVLAFTSSFAGQSGGPFGPAVDVAPDADDFTRALGFSGRNPAWPSAL